MIPEAQHDKTMATQKFPTVVDSVFDLHGSYVLRRLIRPQALRSGNRNPGHNR